MERFTTIIGNAKCRLKEWLMPVMAVLVLLFIFSIAGGGVSQNDKWRIDNIIIEGNSVVSADDVRDFVKEKLAGNYFFVYARENSYLYPRQEIEEGLLDMFPRLASAKVSRVSMHTIAVTVSERKPYALWCGTSHVQQLANLSDCWFIDDTGFVFDRAPVFSEGVYLETYGELVEKKVGEPLRGMLPYNRFAVVNSFIKLFRAEMGDLLRVEFKPEGEVEATIQNSVKYPFLFGVAVRFKDDQKPATLIKNLSLTIPVQFPDNSALEKKLLYIDMRFGNKIFFGFEN